MTAKQTHVAGGSSVSATTISAADLAELGDAYTLKPGPPISIQVPNASRLAGLGEVTLTGTLLNRQAAQLDLSTGKRTFHELGDGTYPVETDGDVHLDIGSASGKPHVDCELQHAKTFTAEINKARGFEVSVTGWVRMLFEHPGLSAQDDAHIVEIHPVRRLAVGDTVLASDVGRPDAESIHTWLKPHDLNQSDAAVSVSYDTGKDTLTFTGLSGLDENYVTVTGELSDVKVGTAASPVGTATLTSPDVTHPLTVRVLPETTAATELNGLAHGGQSVSVLGLRTIDLTAALNNTYTINLIAITITSAP